MAKKRGWRPTPGMVLSGLAGATVATLIAVSPQFTQELDRRDLASDMQKQFRKQGLQYSVTLAEGRDTVLRVEAPSMTRSFAEYLTVGPRKTEYLGGMGFTAIVFANSKGERWTYDLGERRFR